MGQLLGWQTDERKTEHGPTLVVLGVQVAVDQEAFHCHLPEDKRIRWQKKLERSLRENRLLPGTATKLAGRLQWANTCIFHKCGRAIKGRLHYPHMKHMHVELWINYAKILSIVVSVASLST